MLLQEEIAQCYEDLNVTDRRILGFISQDPEKFAQFNAEQAADYCAVSRATFLRAIRKAGIDSFAALKYLCSRSIHRQDPANPSTIHEICRNMEAAFNQLILHCKSRLKPF